MKLDEANVEQWGLFELVLRGRADGNPFVEVEFAAQFTHGRRSIESNGFYDGEGVYRVRFMPDEQGQWSFRTLSNREELDGVEGGFTCVAPSAGNHGPVHVVNAVHFAYADGTPYHPVGTTCYVWNLQDEALEEKTLETLKASPFNKLRFCVFPKHYLFNNNEPPRYPFPGERMPETQPAPAHRFDWDFSRFNPDYFCHLEQRILDLQKLGIEADLILFHPYDGGNWGFDRMPAEVNERYLRYIVARLAAFRNLWWSFANEYDLLYERSIENWDNAFKLVQEKDPYNHLRSVHNMLKFYDHSKPWVTHCSIQHHDISQMTKWLKQYNKPVVIDECGYEGDIDQGWGNLSPQELVMRFWLGFTDGGYVGHGETYWNEAEVLWWSKGGTLHGESVPRIAFLRQIIDQVPGYGLKPITPTRFSAFDTYAEMHTLLTNRDAAVKLVGESAAVIHDSPFNIIAAGYSGAQYYLFYFGTHQPRSRTFHLPKGIYRIDIIDTWNMTIETALDNACGMVSINLPVRPYLAVRIQKMLVP